jgi:hypothetical protein
MGFGGPVWHASGNGEGPGVSEALARRALIGVGDAGLGEWRQESEGGVVHVRRRLAVWEAQRWGVELRDVRGTLEHGRRVAAVVREVSAAAALARLELGA